MSKLFNAKTIIKGIKNLKKVELPEYDAHVYIRPLSNLEQTDVQAIIIENMNIDKDEIAKLQGQGEEAVNKAIAKNASLGDMVRAQARAEEQMVILATVDDKGARVFSDDMLGQLPAGLAKALSEAIKAHSDMEADVTDIAPFREE